MSSPLALLAGGPALDREVSDVMKELGDGPLIFNFGHGIFPKRRLQTSNACSSVFVDNLYVLWLKALHIVAVIAWMAGMLYLPRLFVYHPMAQPRSELSETLKTMERAIAQLHHDAGDVDHLDRWYLSCCWKARGWGLAGFTPSSLQYSP